MYQSLSRTVEILTRLLTHVKGSTWLMYYLVPPPLISEHRASRSDTASPLECVSPEKWVLIQQSGAFSDLDVRNRTFSHHVHAGSYCKEQTRVKRALRSLRAELLLFQPLGLGEAAQRGGKDPEASQPST